MFQFDITLSSCSTIGLDIHGFVNHELNSLSGLSLFYNSLFSSPSIYPSYLSSIMINPSYVGCDMRPKFNIIRMEIRGHVPYGSMGNVSISHSLLSQDIPELLMMDSNKPY